MTDGLRKRLLDGAAMVDDWRKRNLPEPWEPTALEVDDQGRKFVSGADFLRLRAECLDTQDPDWPEAQERWRAARIVLEEASAETARRNAANARKPRPSRQHPHRAMALRIAGEIRERHPALSDSAVATRAAASPQWDKAGIGVDERPSTETIRGWLPRK